MEKPTITAEAIVRFQQLHSEFIALVEQSGAELISARTHDAEPITIDRNGGYETITEKDLWTEVFHLGPKCQAGEILEKKYPAVFEASRKAEEKKAEMIAFTKQAWNMDPIALSLGDIIRLIDGMLDYKLKNHNQ